MHVHIHMLYIGSAWGYPPIYIRVLMISVVGTEEESKPAWEHARLYSHRMSMKCCST